MANDWQRIIKWARLFDLRPGSALLHAPSGRHRIKFLGSTIFKFYKWYNRPRTIRIKKLYIVLGAYLIFAIWPSTNSKTIYADPSVRSPAPRITTVKNVDKLPETKLAELPAVEAVAPAAPPVSYGGCVTGVTSANYALNQLIQHESGGRSCATNDGGCFGLLQACPGQPLRDACGGAAECQLTWFATYKLGGYGSWENAWVMWQSRYPHWW